MAKIQGDKRHLAGNPKYDGFSPDLEIDIKVKGDFEVYPKDLPAPTKHPKGDTIKWFNAFGVRHIGGGDADVEYTVTLQKLPANTQLYYLDKNKKDVHEITQFEKVNDNQIRFTLSIGDPPTGAYP
jgi:hypothetical protein